MTGEDLSVQNIQVSTAPVIKGGQAQKQKTVTFMVGIHGPFTLEYVPAETGSADRIKADIMAQVDELRQISSVGF